MSTTVCSPDKINDKVCGMVIMLEEWGFDSDILEKKKCVLRIFAEVTGRAERHKKYGE